MKLTKLVMIISLMLWLTVPSFASAVSPNTVTDYAGTMIKSAIEKDFENYKGSLENAKEDFGLGKEYSYKSAELNDDLPFWTVGPDEELQFGGYIFPISIAGQPAGIVFAEQHNEQWQIASIKNNTEFKQDLSNAMNQLSSRADKARLIYDEPFAIYALEVQSTAGEISVLPMRDHTLVHLSKNNPVTFQEFKQEIKNLKAERAAPGKHNNDGEVNAGGVSNAHPPSSAGFMSLASVSALALLAIGLLAGFYLYKRRNSKT